MSEAEVVATVTYAWAWGGWRSWLALFAVVLSGAQVIFYLGKLKDWW